MPTPEKKKSKKAPILLSEEEKKLVGQLREKRKQLATLRKEMDELEKKIRPLAAKRVVKHKMKRAGITEEEVAALQE